MHIFQGFDLRNTTSVGDWTDIHKRTDGKDSMIYKDALGEIADIILFQNRNAIRQAGSNTAYVGRALFLGAQALWCAWGRGSGYGRYSWNEEKDDRGNKLVVSSGAKFAIKKTRFNSKDFGLMAVDTACNTPVAS